jgi:hypothetical protein
MGPGGHPGQKSCQKSAQKFGHRKKWSHDLKLGCFGIPEIRRVRKSYFQSSNHSRSGYARFTVFACILLRMEPQCAVRLTPRTQQISAKLIPSAQRAGMRALRSSEYARGIQQHSLDTEVDRNTMNEYQIETIDRIWGFFFLRRIKVPNFFFFLHQVFLRSPHSYANSCNKLGNGNKFGNDGLSSSHIQRADHCCMQRALLPNQA